VRAVVSDYTRAPLSDRERVLLDFAVKLTREPAASGEKEILSLRGHGWSDRAILDCTLIISYFNFVNRIADGLGVRLEDGMEESR
jgi:uncharacterized peroxidase-related enzyme